MVVGQSGDLPIGVFDSGLGGLTVVRAMMAAFPNEKIIYLGDNARVPYGTRSPQTVLRYAFNCADFLVRRGLKMLVVACNTASAVAVPQLSQRLDIPVLGVINAGALAAVAASRDGRVGVIGTAGTVGTGAYPKAIGALRPDVKVFQNPAPLLVPLVEEGWLSGEVPRLAVSRYLTPLVAKQMDVLLLGCTHYPVLQSVIESTLLELGNHAHVVDSASAMAAEVGHLLEKKGLGRSIGPGGLECYVTDLPGNFADVASRFLGHDVGHIEKVDIS